MNFNNKTMGILVVDLSCWCDEIGFIQCRIDEIANRVREFRAVYGHNIDDEGNDEWTLVSVKWFPRWCDNLRPLVFYINKTKTGDPRDYYRIHKENGEIIWETSPGDLAGPRSEFYFVEWAVKVHESRIEEEILEVSLEELKDWVILSLGGV